MAGAVHQSTRKIKLLWLGRGGGGVSGIRSSEDINFNKFSYIFCMAKTYFSVCSSISSVRKITGNCSLLY